MKQVDLVIASHLIQFDMDLTAFGRRHGELPDMSRAIESDPALVQLAADAYDALFDSGGTDPNLMLGTRRFRRSLYPGSRKFALVTAGILGPCDRDGRGRGRLYLQTK